MSVQGSVIRLGEVTELTSAHRAELQLVDPRKQLIPPLVEDWLDSAHCADTDPATFFKATVKALAYCEACPVSVECLERAMTLSDAGFPPQGVWGGQVFT